jgi:hypothetical protein
MKELDKWIRIFEIFKKYEDLDDFKIVGQHDVIHLVIDEDRVFNEDIEELEKLGVWIGEYGFQYDT